MAFQKIPFKFKLNFKHRTNIWANPNIQKKLTKQKWKNIFLNSSVYRKIGYFALKKLKKSKRVKKITLKWLFKNKLQEKQKFRYFYGNLLNYRLKKFHVLAKKKSKYQVFKNFIQLLESKLDVVLYRSFFINNIFSCKHLIKTGKILVNNKIIRNNHYILRPGDIIRLKLTKEKKKELLKNYIKNYKTFFRWKKDYNRTLFLKLLFPKHLEISYKTLTILYKTESKFTSYPIRLNLNFISRYY